MAGRSAAVAAPEPVATKPAVKSKPSTMFGGASSKPAAKPAKAAPASLVTSWYDTGVRLDTGVVTLLVDYTVCKEGATLESDATKLLQLLGVKMAVFKLDLKGRWSRDDGSFEPY